MTDDSSAQVSLLGLLDSAENYRVAWHSWIARSRLTNPPIGYSSGVDCVGG